MRAEQTTPQPPRARRRDFPRRHFHTNRPSRDRKDHVNARQTFENGNFIFPRFELTVRVITAFSRVPADVRQIHNLFDADENILKNIISDDRKRVPRRSRGPPEGADKKCGGKKRHVWRLREWRCHFCRTIDDPPRLDATDIDSSRINL